MLRCVAAFAVVAWAAVAPTHGAGPDAELDSHVLGTKAPYHAPEAADGAPAPCRLIHVSQVQRHGSRNVLSLSKLSCIVKTLRQADAAGTLKDSGLLRRAKTIMERQGAQLGQISPRGRAEMRGLGTRFAEGFLLSRRPAATELPTDDAEELPGTATVSDHGPECTVRGRVEATGKPRVLDSRDEFLAALEGTLGGGELKLGLDVATPPVCHDDPWGYSSLRFYDTCRSYNALLTGEAQGSSAAEDAHAAAWQRLEAASARADGLVDSLLGESGKSLSPRQRRQFLQDALALCRTERGMRFRKAVVCPLLAAWGAEEASAVAGEEEAVDYWFKGPGSPRARAAACPLLRGMLSGVLSAIEDEEAAPLCAPTVALRFGHVETLMPLVGLLGLHQLPPVMEAASVGAETWRSDQVCPMAANLQMLLYACNGPSVAAGKGTEDAESSPGSASGGGMGDEGPAGDPAARRLLGGASDTLSAYSVEFRLNERPVPLLDPVCHGEVRCPLHLVAAALQRRLEELGVGECTEGEWSRACSGVVPC